MSAPSAVPPALGHLTAEAEPKLPGGYEPIVRMPTCGQYQCPFVGCVERPPSKPFWRRDALMRHLSLDHAATYAFGVSDEGDAFLPSDLGLGALNTYRNQLHAARGNAATHPHAPAEVRRALEDTVVFPVGYTPILANTRTGAHHCPVLGCPRGPLQPFTQTARLKSHFMTHHFAEYDNGLLQDNGNGTFTSPTHNTNAYPYHHVLARARIDAAIEASQPRRRSRAVGRGSGTAVAPANGAFVPPTQQAAQLTFLAAASLAMQPVGNPPQQNAPPNVHRMVPLFVDPNQLPALQQLEARDAMLAAQSALAMQPIANTRAVPALPSLLSQSAPAQHPNTHRHVPVMVDPSQLPVLQQLQARAAQGLAVAPTLTGLEGEMEAMEIDEEPQ